MNPKVLGVLYSETRRNVEIRRGLGELGFEGLGFRVTFWPTEPPEPTVVTPAMACYNGRCWCYRGSVQSL